MPGMSLPKCAVVVVCAKTRMFLIVCELFLLLKLSNVSQEPDNGFPIIDYNFLCAQLSGRLQQQGKWILVLSAADPKPDKDQSDLMG